MDEGKRSSNIYAEDYINFLIHFHADRDYFECHEVLEAYWKEDPLGPFRNVWIGLIQVAVSLYHQRRGNIEGARKMMGNALQHLEHKDVAKQGIEAKAFIEKLQARELQLITSPDRLFVDLNIPIDDSELLRLCKEECMKRNLQWEQPSDLLDDQLIHKHMMRDRTEAIHLRAVEKERRHRSE